MTMEEYAAEHGSEQMLDGLAGDNSSTVLCEECGEEIYNDESYYSDGERCVHAVCVGEYLARESEEVIARMLLRLEKHVGA